ncbi:MULTISPECIES: zinc-binding alcohol dehydrogenase [unclassified Ectothiorhodospira]|uniref:zinc-dependent alcohol dehydrogenase n=1 Tax=unclassified Ectothiorhodospira TaxID=2684909 RepID=UPI001EE8D99A|nr:MULTISPECIES: zinc-binding alcohol dehydrogenase [unclassified Ectothiorhodospira]MCG5514791.1 zinc-binding alcohol dehydrogenase [Ectothiorhodospira sp. 9100]MCG5518959.1 zinc-binding alcohol dehydrogenase [Ectothiorhodospira sp. 9905]
MPIDRDAATAFWIATPGRGELRREILPPLPADHVQVTALYSGISRGTESLVFHGHVPPTEYQRMRAPFQAGDFPGPVKYGYASVGRVDCGPADLMGRSVFCLHPHQDHYQVPATAVTPLPGGLPPGRAVLAANMETAINGIWDAGIGPGDRVCVIGAGVVGALVAYLAARIPGTRVTLVDINEGRAALAKALGAGFARPEAAPGDQDHVIHVSGQPDGLDHALTLAGDEGLVLEMSWYGDRPVTLPLGGAFHARRLTLRSSQVGRLPPSRTPRWDYRRRLALALELLKDPVLEPLISGESDFLALPRVMPSLADGGGQVLCHRIRYPAAMSND